MRRRGALAIGLILLLVAGVAVAGVIVWKNRHPGSLRGSASEEFDTQSGPGATRPEKLAREIPWPTYGFDNARTRYAPDFKLKPPYRIVWGRGGGSLIEFPPVIAYGRLYVATNHGRVLAIDAKTGAVAWKKEQGLCTAASPAVANHVLYQGFMDPSPCVHHSNASVGYLIAYDTDSGRELWRFKAGVVESSPLVVGDLVYFGSWDGKVWAVNVKTHKAAWSFSTGDKVKNGVAYANGTIYTASYDHKVYALAARTGKLRWSASGAANWYATPTVAYGRVFIGNTDGSVYAFGARSGHLLWRKATGGYVYSSVGVWNQTVYVGSYDQHFYALNAATGDVRWSFKANGPISGAPTIMDGVVYFSTIRGRTYALDARTGKRVWVFPNGAYSPLVADASNAYLVGYSRIFGLAPKG